MRIPNRVPALAGVIGLCAAAFLAFSRNSEPLVSAQEYGGERVWLHGQN